MINISDIQKQIDKTDKYWIAFVGDSITSCEWVHPNWREIVQYVLNDKLGGDWGFRGFNFGYDGSTTKDILEKVDYIKSVNPDLVIMMIGGNDPFLNVSVEDHIKNINEIKNKLDTSFVLSTDNKPWDDVAISKYLPYIEADKKLGIDKFINLFERSDAFPKERIYTFISEENPVENIKAGDLDYWHPNQLGNAYIAKVILKEVFKIDFDPELYIKDTVEGQKTPKY